MTRIQMARKRANAERLSNRRCTPIGRPGGKLEARISKSETSSNDRNSKAPNCRAGRAVFPRLGHLVFEFVSNFEIRISDFRRVRCVTSDHGARGGMWLGRLPMRVVPASSAAATGCSTTGAASMLVCPVSPASHAKGKSYFPTTIRLSDPRVKNKVTF